MQITNYIGRELNIIYTKNGTNIDSSCSDTKPLLHSCDGLNNEKNGEYLIRIHAFNKILILIYIKLNYEYNAYLYIHG